MGEALDFGTCNAVKKSGEPCSQIVNLVALCLPQLCLSNPVVSSDANHLTLSAVRVPVLPVPRQGPVPEDELQEGRVAVVVFRESPQPGEGEREGGQPERASVSGRLLLRGGLLCCLRRLPVSPAETTI